MRLISTARSKPGMVLGKPVYTQNGSVLVSSGVELTDSIIKRLIKHGIDMVYIKDSRTDDLEIKDPISEKTRHQALKTINDIFVEVGRGNLKWKGSLGQGQLDRIKDSFDAIVAELRQNKSALNLISNVYVNDQYVFSHSFNVSLYAITLALNAGYTDKQLHELGLGAILHDIGKMNVDPEILNKPGKLTEEEFEEVKKHTIYGYDILRKSDGIPLVTAHCALQHHERLDGSGYPRQLKGDEIHPHARILAVADVFDALTSRRSYRPAILPHEAMEVLYAGAGRQFDAKLVEIFRNVVAIYPVGITVTLNTGETGVVVDYNRHSPGRPIVRLLTDPRGEAVKEFKEIDLSKHLSIAITGCEMM
ncbi:MAG: HD-GYP domain-containing protein [Bacillaceae bacterium]|nr:HD-GYP domain-containing protein [Bacillaceae bacterium]